MTATQNACPAVIEHCATPTPDEFAAMTAEDRQAAFAAMDYDAMTPELQQAYLRAAMTAPAQPPRNERLVMHVRKPYETPGFHTSSSGYVYRNLDVEPAKTFCGAAPGDDITYADVARRRADHDWAAEVASYPTAEGGHGVELCIDCLATALKLKEQRSAKRAQRRKP